MADRGKRRRKNRPRSRSKKEKLFAIVHDGTFEGDSNYQCPGEKIPYKDGQTWNEIKEAFLKQRMKDEGYDDVAEFIEEFGYDKIAGAWVVTEKQFEMIELVWESDPGCDSAVYTCNYTAKCMAEKACVAYLGKKPKMHDRKKWY